MIMNFMTDIFILDSDRTVRFAASELKKYLERMSDRKVKILCRLEYDDSQKGIWLGYADEFPGISLPAVKDKFLDDAICIDIKEANGVIAGNNKRSILLAVYRYLAELGCRWIRPGKDGECIPATAYWEKSVKVVELPSYRHRAAAVEGAFSIEHAEDFVDWLPKAGFNGCYLQFRDGYMFFERWYLHLENPLKQRETFDVDVCRKYAVRLTDEIKKRGLVFHAVGHSWTCESIGIPSTSGNNNSTEKPDIEGVEGYLARIGGKRDLWTRYGMDPQNTNLCYSKAEVRKAMVRNAVNYIKENPLIDILHFWLADGFNNFCECEECSKYNPSDWYVKLLNELDETLDAEGIKTRIVFLNYVDLLWAPLKERLKNQDRFILMFAPITRSYSRELASEGGLPTVSEYVLNKTQMPSSPEENLAYLKTWQQWFKGDSFIFDYHLWRQQFKDPGHMQISDILLKDIKNLKSLGLDGCVAVSTVRCFLPDGFGFSLMGRALWNKELDFSEAAHDFFTSAYGSDGILCMDYLIKLSELFQPEYLSREVPAINAGASIKFAEIRNVIKDFRPVIERNLKLADQNRAKSWEYLSEHALICCSFSEILEAAALGKRDIAFEKWEMLKKALQKKEDILSQVFDVYLFLQYIGYELKDILTLNC